MFKKKIQDFPGRVGTVSMAHDKLSDAAKSEKLHTTERNGADLRYKESRDTFCESTSRTGQNHLQHVSLQLLHHHEYLPARQTHVATHNVKPFPRHKAHRAALISISLAGKLVSSACYDTQEVCVYLQPFSC